MALKGKMLCLITDFHDLVVKEHIRIMDQKTTEKVNQNYA